jgi:hypothetical protein
MGWNWRERVRLAGCRLEGAGLGILDFVSTTIGLNSFAFNSCHPLCDERESMAISGCEQDSDEGRIVSGGQIC